MRILVAGGAGYIGSCCTEYLLDHGHEVVVFDSLVKGHRAAVDPRARFIWGELADRSRVFRTLEAEQVDGIIHFAAFIEVGESMRDPGKYFRNNVACGLNLFDAAVATGVGKIVFSSTAAVYGMPEHVPIPESESTRPINPYGESKLIVEKILRWYWEVHGLRYHALRYFNAAGATEQFGEAHDPESHLIPIVLQVAEGRRKKVSVYGNDYPTPDGTCIRDYIHVLDLAQAHALALESPEVGSLNLGSGSGSSVQEIIDMARRITGHPIPAEIAPRRPGDPPRLISDSTAARGVLGWTPQFDDIHAIVESAWKWRLAHPDGYRE
ncbi:MAG: UDP-glucose 4-epimerase GalE [Kiritimatiellaeota bacterium]|nr:UDP-glucose 4-epimerase GalE [Kiritimatiellota bacterium]